MSWSQRLTRFLACLALATPGMALPSGANAALLVADYQFQDTFASSVPGAPDLTVIGTGGVFTTDTVNGQSRRVFDFDAGTGLQAKTTSLIAPDDYSIVIQVNLDLLSIITKLIDFKNLTSDTGLYVENGFLSFHNNAVATGGTIVIPGGYVQFVLTRDGTSDLVSAYTNGAPDFSFTDTGDLGVISSDDFLTFFKDDSTPSTEDSSGRVACIRLYQGALAANEVASLECAVPGAVPEPSSVALIALGFVSGLIAYRRRRDKRFAF